MVNITQNLHAAIRPYNWSFWREVVTENARGSIYVQHMSPYQIVGSKLYLPWGKWMIIWYGQPLFMQFIFKHDISIYFEINRLYIQYAILESTIVDFWSL